MIAVCGEVLIDLVADDLAAVRYTAIPGGSPGNVAIALARLGVPAILLARLSGDTFGVRLREHLASNGVGLALAVAATERTSLAVVTVDHQGEASYRFDIDGTADWQWSERELPADLTDDVTAIHTGSLSLILPPGGEVIERFLAEQRAHRTISIDPNVRPSIVHDLAHYRSAVERWLALADIVKVSEDDLAALYPGARPADVARLWSASGPSLVVVTLGAEGAFAVCGGELVEVSVPPVTVVDTVAAGDTFTAGLLSHLHDLGRLGGRLTGLDVTDVRSALAYGAAAAAVTCSRPGADPPYAREVAALR